MLFDNLAASQWLLASSEDGIQTLRPLSQSGSGLKARLREGSRKKRPLGDPSKTLGHPVEILGSPSGKLWVTQGSKWGKCVCLQQIDKNPAAPRKKHSAISSQHSAKSCINHRTGVG